MSDQSEAPEERAELPPEKTYQELHEEEREERTELPAEETYGEKLLPAITWVLLIIFAVGNLACLTLFFLNGFGVTSLSDVALGGLAAATIAEVAGLIGIILRRILA